MKDILDLEIQHCCDTYTIRSFLRSLLETLWEEGEQFSGKRPLGDSDWQSPVDQALVEAGHIHGTLDENGALVESDYHASDTIIKQCIHYLFEENK